MSVNADRFLAASLSRLLLSFFLADSVASAQLSASTLSSGRIGLEKVSSQSILKKDGRIDQVIPLPSGDFLVRDYSWQEEEKQAIEIYSSEGAFLRKIGSFGQSPGHYFRLKSAALASNNHLWIGDAHGRISIFDLSGELIETILIQKPGFRVRDIVLDESNGFFYLTGCLPVKTYLDLGCELVHQYQIDSRKHVSSFIETDPVAVANHWLSLEDYSVGVDAGGRVFMTDSPVFKLMRFDPSSKKVQAFPISSEVAKSPEPIYEPSPEANRRARESSFLIERVVVAGQYVVVSMSAPTSTPSPESAKRLLHGFGLDGGQIWQDLPSPGALSGKNNDGVLLFITKVEDHFQLDGYRITSTAAVALSSANE